TIAVRFTLHLHYDKAHSEMAETHSNKVKELKLELIRTGGTENHLRIADDCANYILAQRTEWQQTTRQYAWLSNGLILITLCYVVVLLLNNPSNNKEEDS
ncbi:MAG: hypothetical protein GX811_00485, partial [Lentisphaerae bacterium]|nr:hypothetical protein [Lentisphaerota bacterium]